MNSLLVLVTESSAAIDAIINYKPLLSYTSDCFDDNQKFHNQHYVNELGIPVLDIDSPINNMPKKQRILKLNKKKYNNYIKKYIEPDNKELPGHLKFSKIIKEQFLSNDKT